MVNLQPTKAQLQAQADALRQRVAELEAVVVQRQQASTALLESEMPSELP